jgi:hypothetical protein
VPQLCKFSSGPEAVEFTHGDTFEVQRTPDYSRVVFGARRGELGLILNLCRDLQGPFGILYVLSVSRRGNPLGRYQSPREIDIDELVDLLEPHRDFLEQDGRHSLWIRSFAGDGQFILDRHNVIFAYGDVDQIAKRLEARGFQEAPVKVPAPHSHYYHKEFDDSEDAMLQTWDWIRTDLQPSDTE